MYDLVRGLKADINLVEGFRCMRGSYGKLFFTEVERGSVEGLYGKDHE